MPLPVLAILNLDSIDDGRRWNVHPFLHTVISSGLKASCERVGILRPPLVLASHDGRYDMLDGRQRMTVAREILGLRQCPCLILPATTPAQVVLTMLLESQCCTAPLSPMETAHFLNLLRQVPETAQHSGSPFESMPCERFGIVVSRRTERLLQLEDNLQEMVHTLFLSEAMALELLKLQAEDRHRLAELFRTFGMGGGKQKRFFSLIRDIAGRNATSIAAILDQPPIRDILLHQEMNQPQKVHAMLSVLQQLASPSLNAAEETFRQRVAALDPPPGCTIQHRQSFETDDVDLTIRFRDFSQLEQSWPTVKEMLRRNAGQR
jgi:hypothetical protein